MLQGVRTFYATNHVGQRPNDSSLVGESWGYYPDAKPPRSFFAGDPRAAMVPFLAHKCANNVTISLLEDPDAHCCKGTN